jgi:hypothetical protein
VYQLPESGLALDDAEWDIELTAERWKPNDEFKWVNVLRDNDKASLLVLNEPGDVVQAVLQNVWLAAVSAPLCSLGSAFLLLCLGFRAILSEEAVKGGLLWLVEGLAELVHWRRNLEARH